MAARNFVGWDAPLQAENDGLGQLVPTGTSTLQNRKQVAIRLVSLLLVRLVLTRVGVPG